MTKFYICLPLCALIFIFQIVKVGLNTYFLVGFKCIFKIHLFLIFLKLDFCKLNKAN
jgi:hypothetical protein